MATMNGRSCKGIFQCASFPIKKICDEEEVVKLQLTAEQRNSTESQFVTCQASEHQAVKLALRLVESAYCFSTKDRSHLVATE